MTYIKVGQPVYWWLAEWSDTLMAKTVKAVTKEGRISVSLGFKGRPVYTGDTYYTSIKEAVAGRCRTLSSKIEYHKREIEKYSTRAQNVQKGLFKVSEEKE